LTEISQRYTKIVRYILEFDASRLSETFPPETIAEFKQRHSETAFPCRYRFCPRASSGFPTEKERQRHETSHRPRIKCPIASCEFHLFGFGSQQALERHISQYHRDREGMGNQGSKLIRRNFNLSLRARFMESETASTNQRDLELRHHLSLRKAWFRVVSSCRRFQIGTQNLLTTPLRDLPSHQAPRTLHPRIMNTHSPLVLTNLTEGGNNVSFLLPYKS